MKQPPFQFSLVFLIPLLLSCQRDPSQPERPELRVLEDGTNNGTTDDTPGIWGRDWTIEGEGTGSSCLASDLRLELPLEGDAGTDWVVHNLVDHAPEGSQLNFRGQSDAASWTYDGHDGVDLMIGGFAEMDRGLAVLAAAPGVVELVNDNFQDRQMERLTCRGTPWNSIRIRHSYCYVSVYGHLARRSATVQAGEVVVAGQVLARVGSSGCSTSPHLHLEVRDCQDRVVDPFGGSGQPSLWAVPPNLNPSLGVLTLSIADRPLERAEVFAPPAFSGSVPLGARVHFGLILGGGEPADSVTVRCRTNESAEMAESEVTLLSGLQPGRMSVVRGINCLPAAGGSWFAEVVTSEGVVLAQQGFSVVE